MDTQIRTPQRMRILITVKTYPIPSAKYDELVCTAGVTPDGDFVRLYPINFRDLAYEQQYRKYQWVEVCVEKHGQRDVRKESYRPDCDTLRLIGDPILTKNGDWSARTKYVLRKRAASMEQLHAQQDIDGTSLGVFRPRVVRDLVVVPDDRQWKASFTAALRQARLWDSRTTSKEPPRKVPFKFRYRFECDDPACKGNHEMMIEDWEVGALYWKLRDKGASESEAVSGVRHKFLDVVCGQDKDTHFYVGTVSSHPKSWVVIGVLYPKRMPSSTSIDAPTLFPT